MLRFKDFVPELKSAPGFFKAAEFDSFDAAVAAADVWIREQGIDVVSLETVVLPNIWSRAEEGTTDVSLHTRKDFGSTWHQFVRCWYHSPEE